MIRRKSKFWTFCFSLIPGAGEMYLGYGKRGVSLMGIFWLVIALASLLGMGPLLFLMPIIWFYSFFDTHHLSGMSDQELAVEKDDFLFNVEALIDVDIKRIDKYRKAIAVVLILLGAAVLWNVLLDLSYDYLPDYIYSGLRRIGNILPRLLLGGAVVAAGAAMIKGKRIELSESEEEKETKRPDKE